MKFFSSGGLGDAYICFMKILEQAKGYHVSWEHMTSHQVHVEPITELMNLVPDISHGKCHKITKSTAHETEAMCVDDDTIRLNTVAKELEQPFPELHFIKEGLWSATDELYAVIQAGAGRPDDNSFRYFTPHSVNSICEMYGKKDMRALILGAEYTSAVPDRAENLTGKTTIQSAIEILSGANYFVGHDGFLAYVAMSMRIPSTVVFHDPRLPNHYMHPAWAERSNVRVGPNRISNADLVLQDIDETLRV